MFLRPEFSVLRNAESDYGSAGHYGWLMDLNFVLRCALSLAVVAAIWLITPPVRRLRAGLVALAVWAVASGLLAAFPDDPVGTVQHTTGKVHVALAAAAFLAVLVGTRLVASPLRRLDGWMPAARQLDVLAWLALVPLALMARAGLRPHSLGALWEKVFLAIELLWFLVAARHVRRLGRPPQAAVRTRAKGSAR